MSIGEKLEKIRMQLNITKQAEMAKSIGLEPGSYNDIVRGKTKKLSGSVILVLELRHNVNTDYLTGKSSLMFKPIEENVSLVEDRKEQYKHAKQTDEVNKEAVEIKLLRELNEVLKKANTNYEKDIEQLTSKNKALEEEIKKLQQAKSKDR